VVRLLPTKTAETTGETITFEMKKATKELLLAHLERDELGIADPVFARLRRTLPRRALSARAYRDLVKKWVAAIGLNP
jgi:hypothetical protein